MACAACAECITCFESDVKFAWLQRFSFQTVDDDKIIGIQNEYMIPAPPLHGLKVLVQ